jgi:N-acetylglucosamine-6-phosphate deacetylase
VITETSEWAPGWVAIDGASVHSTGAGHPPAALAAAARENTDHVQEIVAPGFVDMHVHGALGHDFATADVSEARRIVRHHRLRGTTTLIASVASSPPADLRAAIERLAPLVEEGLLGGLHLEGPYLAPRFRGAHDLALLRPLDLGEVQSLVQLGRGTVRVVTLAPEVPGADAVIRWLRANGVRVALGHSGADAATAARAVDAGATIATHLFNGMPPLHHRDVGIAGALLLDERVTVELILDVHHLSGSALELVRRCAPGRFAAVSDAMAATGLRDGEYRVAGSRVRVVNGVATLVEGGTLAGSTITVIDALTALRANRSLSLADALRATSVTASRALGMAPALSPGSPADLVVLRTDGRDLTLNAVMRDGCWVS